MAGDEYPSAAFVETGFVADKWSAAEELSRIADIAITTAATDAAFVVPVALKPCLGRRFRGICRPNGT